MCRLTTIVVALTACAISLCAWPQFVCAIDEEYHVNIDNDFDVCQEFSGLSREDGFPSIQCAIDEAGDYDTIFVWPGVYHEELDFQGKKIRITSGSAPPIIAAPDPNAIGVTFFTGENNECVLSHVILAGFETAILCVGTSPLIEHVTVAENNVGLNSQFGSSPYVRNSIFWFNGSDDIFGIGPVVEYSCIENGYAGTGNITDDPLMENPFAGEYQLLSEEGRAILIDDFDELIIEYEFDQDTSPCIDAGDPFDNPTDEWQPSGGRVNMGAYGNTPLASLSLNPWPNPADISFDGTVDLDDYYILVESWLAGYCFEEGCEADINKDDFVNMLDFSILMDEWLWEAIWF